MRTSALLLFVTCAVMPGAVLQPVTAIDFSKALNAKPHHLPIVWTAATADGVTVAGGSAPYAVTVARATRAGTMLLPFRLRVPEGGGDSFAARPDGSIWFGTRWTGSDFPAPPATLVGVDTTAVRPTRQGPANFDLYTGDGRYVESFRVVGSPAPGLPGVDFARLAAASEKEIVLVYAGLIRAGHTENGDFIINRDWHANGGGLIFPFDADRFAVVNRFSGEFTIIDPRAPDTRIIATPFKTSNPRNRPPVTAANGSIWFLVPGASKNSRDLVQYAPDGSIVSRTTLDLAPGVKPLKLAISGRDVYVSGVTATVYCYELPQ